VDNLNAISGPPLSQTSIERLIGIFGTVGRNVGPADASE
jgi:hypothetical protein